MNILLPSVQLVIVYRVYSFMYKFWLLKPFSFVVYYFARIFFSSDIHPAAKIGSGFSIRHHFAIVIGKNVVIGNNVIVYNCVSVGQKNIHSDVMPKIGDDVIIYKGATIVGDVNIHDGTVIPAHSFIK